jgi:deoxyribonuclease-4
MTLPFCFGTVGAPLSTPKKPGGSVGGVLHSHTLGLDTLELAWVRSVSVTTDTCSQIRAVAAQCDLALSVHAPYFINLNATDAEWQNGQRRLLAAANAGYLAGATDIIFHPGSYFGNDPAQVLAVAIPRLQTCVETLRAAGNQVTLRPETMGKSALLGALSDVLAMAQAVPGVLPCLDIAHLHARTGDGSLNSYSEFAQVLEQIGQALGADALRHLHIHISGIAYTAKGEKHHLPFAEADFAYREFLQALADFGCAGRLLCESPAMEADALLLRQVATQIW